MLLYLSKEVLGRGITMHRYRDSFATEVIQTTGNIVLAQMMLGHLSPKTTLEVYTNINTREYSRQYDRMRLDKKVQIQLLSEERLQLFLNAGIGRQEAQALIDQMAQLDRKWDKAA